MTIRSRTRRTVLHLTLFLALAGLVGQPFLTHLHGVDVVVVSDAVGLGRASTDGAAEHDRGDCPLCLARVQSRTSVPAPAPALAIPAAHGDVRAVAALMPPARPATGIPTLRGPPASA